MYDDIDLEVSEENYSGDHRILQFEHFQEIVATLHEEKQPFLKITKQPSKLYRYRYESEGANIHQLLNSEYGPKSYPTVQLFNYDKEALIRCVACRTKEEDYKIHCHYFKVKIGKEYSADPVYLLADRETNYTAVFQGGIIFTRKHETDDIMKEKLKIIKDNHWKPDQNLSLNDEINWQIDNLKTINTNKVVLRFDAYGQSNEGLFRLCEPVYSTPIRNQKSAATGDLRIVRLNSVSGSCIGGEEVYILVEKLSKDVKVRFFDDTTWEAFGSFNPTDVHRQYAIVFKTPPYKDVNIEYPVKVSMELQRNDEHSEPRTFIYLPHKMQRQVKTSDSDTN